MSKWTEERVDLTVRRWKEGVSGTDIANELGNGFSKSAVIGKMFRMGLSQQGGSRTSRPVSERKQSDKVIGRARTSAKAQARTLDRMFTGSAPKSKYDRLLNDQPVLPSPELPPTDHSGAEAVHSLVDGACKWPVGDPLSPQFRFCNCRQAPGFVYCGYHARMAYQPASRRTSPAYAEPVRRSA